MKKTGKWFASIVSKALIVILVILLLPFAGQLFQLILPGITGEISTQSRILKQKLESSQRLEVTTVEEDGILEAKTDVIILGTVGKTTIRYKYKASLGIDLNEVVLMPDSDRILFYLPDPVILNDGIEAIEVKRQDFFSHAIEIPNMWKRYGQIHRQHLKRLSANGLIPMESVTMSLNFTGRKKTKSNRTEKRK